MCRKPKAFTIYIMLQSGIQEEHTHCTMCEIIVCVWILYRKISTRVDLYKAAGERARSARDF
jgi:hypothetical protein